MNPKVEKEICGKERQRNQELADQDSSELAAAKATSMNAATAAALFILAIKEYQKWGSSVLHSRGHRTLRILR